MGIIELSGIAIFSIVIVTLLISYYKYRKNRSTSTVVEPKQRNYDALFIISLVICALSLYFSSCARIALSGPNDPEGAAFAYLVHYVLLGVFIVFLIPVIVFGYRYWHKRKE